jgi:hypothetical protein
MAIPENRPSDQELRETLLAVRAKLKVALHLSKDLAHRRERRCAGKR